jgi:hypothetical protein
MDTFSKFFKKVNPDIDYDPRQVKMEVEVEKEHTNDPSIAEKIAKQHLAEDPKYYTKLKKINQFYEYK